MEPTDNSYETSFEKLIKHINEDNSVYLIGVAGVPGAGKTTFCSELTKRIPNSIILPMDGYHIPRNNLDEKGLKYRGAPYTFDHKRLLDDLINLKKNKIGSFPSFDHALKDPVENDIIVKESHKVIIVEGLYLFTKEWKLNELFDVKVFIDCPIDIAVDRLAKRHLQCGIVKTLEEGIDRAYFNDKPNGEYVLNESCLDAFIIKTNE